MKKEHSPPSRPTAAAFTLIELLVVIGIIGILAAIMFPAANGAMRRAAQAHAENTCYQLKNSISAYFTEYRKYPVAQGTTEGTVFRTDNTLMDVLLGGDSEARQGGLNPRRIVFYTDKQARPLGGGEYARGVVLNSDGGGELWDPFGEHYYVVMDLDYNNRVSKPTWDISSASSVLPESILVWSSGPSKDENYAADNIKTW